MFPFSNGAAESEEKDRRANLAARNRMLVSMAALYHMDTGTLGVRGKGSVSQP